MDFSLLSRLETSDVIASLALLSSAAMWWRDYKSELRRQEEEQTKNTPKLDILLDTAGYIPSDAADQPTIRRTYLAIMAMNSGSVPVTVYPPYLSLPNNKRMNLMWPSEVANQCIYVDEFPATIEPGRSCLVIVKCQAVKEFIQNHGGPQSDDVLIRGAYQSQVGAEYVSPPVLFDMDVKWG